MVLSVPTSMLLERLERTVKENLEAGWVAEPHAARVALLVREELGCWTETTYAGSTCQAIALESDSRRLLGLTIHSAPNTHRVEIWGLACGDDREARPAPLDHTVHSWVLVAHLGGSCGHLNEHLARLRGAGLKLMNERRGDHLHLSLWMGASAPNGCPACLAEEK